MPHISFLFLQRRSYVYVEETELYYLQSRYYNPEIGRFINADALVSTGQGLLGNNMFAYCLNNPVNYIDVQGNTAEALQWWTAGMAWLPFVDSVLPFGDIAYLGGAVILAIVFSESQDSTPAIVFDEADESYGSPAPNNNDEDDDDDYYEDDSNFGGRERMGKSKGNTPRNNQKQNKQFRDATKGILNKDQQRALHNEISGEGLGFRDILDAAIDLLIVCVCLF